MLAFETSIEVPFSATITIDPVLNSEIPSFTELQAVEPRGQLTLSEADRAARASPVAYLMLCAAIVSLLNFADAPPFNEMNSLLQICLLGATMMWGGGIAAIAAFLLVVGIDFFLPDPVFSLGVQDWRGFIELAFGSVLALGLGISAGQVFQSLLDPPSHSLGSN